jgi:hypothetical protein
VQGLRHPKLPPRAPVLRRVFDADILNIATKTPSLSQEEMKQAEEASFLLAIIVGGTIGGLCAAAAVFALVRRHYRHKRADLQVAGMATKILKPRFRTTEFTAENPEFRGDSFKVPAVEALAKEPGSTTPVYRPLRTRFSFHGDDIDELDVGAGWALRGVKEYPLWWLAMDDATGQVGLVPASFVMEV